MALAASGSSWARASNTSARGTLRGLEDHGHAAGGHALVGVVDDDAAVHAPHHGDEALGLEVPQGLAQRGAGDAEAGDEIGLVAERLPVGELTGEMGARSSSAICWGFSRVFDFVFVPRRFWAPTAPPLQSLGRSRGPRGETSGRRAGVDGPVGRSWRAHRAA